MSTIFVFFDTDLTVPSSRDTFSTVLLPDMFRPPERADMARPA